MVNNVSKKFYEKCVDDLRTANKIILLIYRLGVTFFYLQNRNGNEM